MYTILVYIHVVLLTCICYPADQDSDNVLSVSDVIPSVTLQVAN